MQSQSGDLQIEDMIAEALKENLVPIISDLLRLPMVPRMYRDQLISIAVDTIVNALAEATSIDELIEEFLNQ